MEGETSRSSKIAEDVIQTLKTRGWCIGDLDQVNAIVLVQSALSDDGKASTIADSVESQLLDMDLRSIGGKSLPDAISFRKASHLQGRKVLQISSMRDVAVSTIDAFSSSGHRRLLKLVLTDGHSEIPAIEYSHLPSVGNDIAPGAKVRVENKATIHSGILCLNPKVMTVIGGVVQSLYDEWHMNQKYSVFSRSSLRPTEDGGVAGPPAFAKLQAGASSIRPSSQRSRVSDYFQAISKSSMPVAEGFVTKPEVGLENIIKQAENVVDKVKTLEAKENAQGRPLPYAMGPREGYSASTSKSTFSSASEEVQNIADSTSTSNLKPAPLAASNEPKATTSYIRPKEVTESAPVQNQAAAQKLLQKMAPPRQFDRRSRGRGQYRGRGRDDEEESQTWTLEEWQNRNSGAKPHTRNEFPDTSNDEDLAWQLQNQLDMEDSHVQRGPQDAVATDIRMSMFNFKRDGDGGHGMDQRGGRGRGRRGRGSGRGRGRGRHG